MAKLMELYRALDNVLSKSFPEIKIHSNDTKEGFSKPCFFTQIIPMTMDYETVNYMSNKTMIIINYFSETGKEIDNLKMQDKLIKAFGMTLKVNQRHFLCKNIRSEIVDSVLQFRFDLDYLTGLTKEENRDSMENLDLEMRRSD